MYGSVMLLLRDIAMVGAQDPDTDANKHLLDSLPLLVLYLAGVRGRLTAPTTRNYSNRLDHALSGYRITH
jgi:hypothetical protein